MCRRSARWAGDLLLHRLEPSGMSLSHGVSGVDGLLPTKPPAAPLVVDRSLVAVIKVGIAPSQLGATSVAANALELHRSGFAAPASKDDVLASMFPSPSRPHPARQRFQPRRLIRIKRPTPVPVPPRLDPDPQRRSLEYLSLRHPGCRQPDPLGGASAAAMSRSVTAVGRRQGGRPS